MTVSVLRFHRAQLQRWILPWIVPIALIIIWEILADIGWIPVRILPAPSAIFWAGIQLAQSGELWSHLGISAARAATGFFIGASLGLTLGFINGILPIAETLLDSSLQMLRNIPNLALIPLVILWFGIGEEAKIFLVMLGVFFPVYLNTFHGIRNIDPSLLEMGRVYGLNRLQLITNIILPGALPSILVGVRFSLGIAWITLIVSETIATDSGLGYMAMNAREFMQTDIIVFSILLYALLGKLSDGIAKTLEFRLLQWHPNFQSGSKDTYPVAKV
ncbi:ABC transporter permease subunit [Synechococcus elongatus IITB4]|uniref:ABC transporter permease subunit n=1 Tax=Synechococcus elongatus TaxID=32046 RepID=UPI0030D2081A